MQTIVKVKDDQEEEKEEQDASEKEEKEGKCDEEDSEVVRFGLSEKWKSLPAMIEGITSVSKVMMASYTVS